MRKILASCSLGFAGTALAQGVPPGPPMPPGLPPMPDPANAPLMEILRATSTSSSHAEGVLVAGAAFAFTLLIVLAVLAFRRIGDRERHETIRRIVEKGGPIPQELLGTLAPQATALSRGVMLCSIGVGLTVFFMTGRGWSIGVLVLLMGAGSLLIWRLEKKKSA